VANVALKEIFLKGLILLTLIFCKIATGLNSRQISLGFAYDWHLREIIVRRVNLYYYAVGHNASSHFFSVFVF
jgi:hypothetical protein